MTSKNNGLAGKVRDEFMEDWYKTTKKLNAAASVGSFPSIIK